MLYREIIAVCSEIHTKHINTAVWAERRMCVLNWWWYIQRTLGLWSINEAALRRMPDFNFSYS